MVLSIFLLQQLEIQLLRGTSCPAAPIITDSAASIITDYTQTPPPVHTVCSGSNRLFLTTSCTAPIITNYSSNTPAAFSNHHQLFLDIINSYQLFIDTTSCPAPIIICYSQMLSDVLLQLSSAVCRYYQLSCSIDHLLYRDTTS
jgi:hypothetical protein